MKNINLTQPTPSEVFGEKLLEASSIHASPLEFCLQSIKGLNFASAYFLEREKSNPNINQLNSLIDVFCDVALELNELKNRDIDNKAA